MTWFLVYSVAAFCTFAMLALATACYALVNHCPAREIALMAVTTIIFSAAWPLTLFLCIVNVAIVERRTSC